MHLRRTGRHLTFCQGPNIMPNSAMITRFIAKTQPAASGDVKLVAKLNCTRACRNHNKITNVCPQGMPKLLQRQQCLHSGMPESIKNFQNRCKTHRTWSQECQHHCKYDNVCTQECQKHNKNNGICNQEYQNHLANNGNHCKNSDMCIQECQNNCKTPEFIVKTTVSALQNARIIRKQHDLHSRMPEKCVKTRVVKTNVSATQNVRILMRTMVSALKNARIMTKI